VAPDHLVDAIVMAAGEGRRLRPITERWPKPVLPIDGRPVVVTLLRELAEAGCERAWVVTGHLAEQVEELVTGCKPGLEIQFVRQSEPLGSADAVSRALVQGAAPPCLVSAADTVYAPGDVVKLAGSTQAAIAWRKAPPGAALELEDGRVRRVPGVGEHFAAPLWVVTFEVAEQLGGLPGPPFELAGAFQRAIEAGTTVLGVEIGPTRDLTVPADLVRHNFLYLGSDD
jgi:CTP:molybdopterin cytidylyltransferase MocA